MCSAPNRSSDSSEGAAAKSIRPSVTGGVVQAHTQQRLQIRSSVQSSSIYLTFLGHTRRRRLLFWFVVQLTLCSPMSCFRHHFSRQRQNFFSASNRNRVFRFDSQRLRQCWCRLFRCAISTLIPLQRAQVFSSAKSQKNCVYFMSAKEVFFFCGTTNVIPEKNPAGLAKCRENS